MKNLDTLLQATSRLARAVSKLQFAAPITHVYNPLQYASVPHEQYLRKYAAPPKRVLFLGMNPGPFGMAQTGVPFGDVSMVRDYLGIEAPVQKPKPMHPKRPIDGFACSRSEVSGSRLWGAIADHWSNPSDFFVDHFVANYCPLVFMEESGKNRTPDKLPSAEQAPLYAACDAYLRELVDVLQPEIVIGIGKFAEARAKAALADTPVRVATVLHPSPASPRANRGWASEAEKQLRALGIRALG